MTVVIDGLRRASHCAVPPSQPSSTIEVSDQVPKPGFLLFCDAREKLVRHSNDLFPRSSWTENLPTLFRDLGLVYNMVMSSSKIYTNIEQAIIDAVKKRRV